MSDQSPAATASLRVFLVTWFGQLISLIGSGLTSFAVGIKIYQDSGSVTLLSLVSFCYVMPLVVLSPIAGSLIDRWDRRRAMLLADIGAGSGAVMMWGLLAAAKAGVLVVPAWWFLIPIAISSAFDAFRWPAYQAATTLLVPKAHLGRANGLIELAGGVGQVSAPALAAALVVRIGVENVVLIDIASFVFAVASLAFVRFPRPPPSAAGSKKATMLSDSTFGWRFVRGRPGLLGLMVIAVISNLTIGVITVLITPLVLGISNVATLGNVLSIAGLGMLVGGITISVWGGPRRKILGALGFGWLAGFVLLMGAAPPSVPLFAAGAALFLFCAPLIAGCAQTIWQTKTPPDVQGRVFAFRRMIAASAGPLGNLAAGPLADRFFEPWLAPHGALADSVGTVIGTGPGRGIGFLFVLLGMVRMLLSTGAYFYKPVRDIEDELPDAIAGTLSEATH